MDSGTTKAERDQWLKKLSAALQQWLPLHGYRANTKFAEELDIPRHIFGRVVNGSGFVSKNNRDMYARIFKRTGLSQADPRTIPSFIHTLPTGVLNEDAWAWTEEEWQNWLKTVEARRITPAPSDATTSSLPPTVLEPPTSSSPQFQLQPQSFGTMGALLDSMLAAFIAQTRSDPEQVAQRVVALLTERASLQATSLSPLDGKEVANNISTRVLEALGSIDIIGAIREEIHEQSPPLGDAIAQRILGALDTRQAERVQTAELFEKSSEQFRSVSNLLDRVIARVSEIAQQLSVAKQVDQETVERALRNVLADSPTTRPKGGATPNDPIKLAAHLYQVLQPYLPQNGGTEDLREAFLTPDVKQALGRLMPILDAFTQTRERREQLVPTIQEIAV